MRKSVFITGGVKNSGAGITEKFAREGWDVFIGSRNGDEAERLTILHIKNAKESILQRGK